MDQRYAPSHCLHALLISYYIDLPSDFLSTPFGAALRPTIDAMFRQPVPGAAPSPPPAPSPNALQQAASAAPNPALASALLQAVASQAYATGSLSAPTSLPASPSAPRTANPGASTVAAPIHMCSNSSTLHGLLQTHRATVVFFTSATCGPCKMIEPVFEQLAHNKTQGSAAGRIAFVKVDMAMSTGGQVGAEWGVRVTPTFLFFFDAKKVRSLRYSSVAEANYGLDLRTEGR